MSGGFTVTEHRAGYATSLLLISKLQKKVVTKWQHKFGWRVTYLIIYSFKALGNPNVWWYGDLMWSNFGCFKLTLFKMPQPRMRMYTWTVALSTSAQPWVPAVVLYPLTEYKEILYTLQNCDIPLSRVSSGDDFICWWLHLTPTVEQMMKHMGMKQRPRRDKSH